MLYGVVEPGGGAVKLMMRSLRTGEESYLADGTYAQYVGVSPGSPGIDGSRTPPAPSAASSRAVPRITSYNVCYTKLLRAFYHQRAHRRDALAKPGGAQALTLQQGLET